TLALLMAPEDVEVYRKNRGAEAVARMRARGADIRVVEYAFGDHAMFGETFRGVTEGDVLALVKSTLPAGTHSALRS
ncbi:MAG: hypothetical protein Q8M65_03160, partial [Rhodoglobus sp.]|nr:hypothetical protein [Rhodoglobus sp.]